MEDRSIDITGTIGQLLALATLARAMDQAEAGDRERIVDHLRVELEALAGRMYEQGPAPELEVRTFTGSVASLALMALDSDQEHTVCDFSLPAWELLSEAAHRWEALPLQAALGKA